MKLPKLYLRDLFWLVLVCALVVGWWGQWRTAVSAAAAAKLAAEEVQLMQYDAALKADESRKREQELELLTNKLKETGYRWRFMQGYRAGGEPYVFLVED